MTLAPDRWPLVRNEAARVLEDVLRTELRDTAVASERQFLSGRMLAGLAPDERRLAADLIGPLVVANSTYSDTITQQAREAAAAAAEPVSVPILQGEIIVDALSLGGNAGITMNLDAGKRGTVRQVALVK